MTWHPPTVILLALLTPFVAVWASFLLICFYGLLALLLEFWALRVRPLLRR